MKRSFSWPIRYVVFTEGIYKVQGISWKNLDNSAFQGAHRRDTGCCCFWRGELSSFSQSSDLLMSSRISAVGTEPGFSRLAPSPGLFSLLPETIQAVFCQSLEGEKGLGLKESVTLTLYSVHSQLVPLLGDHSLCLSSVSFRNYLGRKRLNFQSPLPPSCQK